MTETNTPSDSVSQPTPPIVPSSEEIDPTFQPYLDAFKLKELVIRNDTVVHTVALNLKYLVSQFCPEEQQEAISDLIKAVEDADSRLELYQLDTGDDHALSADSRQRFQEQFDGANAQRKALGIHYDLFKRAKKMKKIEANRLNRKLNAEDYT